MGIDQEKKVESESTKVVEEKTKGASSLPEVDRLEEQVKKSNNLKFKIKPIVGYNSFLPEGTNKEEFRMRSFQNLGVALDLGKRVGEVTLQYHGFNRIIINDKGAKDGTTHLGRHVLGVGSSKIIKGVEAIVDVRNFQSDIISQPSYGLRFNDAQKLIKGEYGFLDAVVNGQKVGIVLLTGYSIDSLKGSRLEVFFSVDKPFEGEMSAYGDFYFFGPALYKDGRKSITPYLGLQVNNFAKKQDGRRGVYGLEFQF